MFLLGFFVAVVNCILGLIIFFKKRESANRIFGVFACSMAMWIFSIQVTVYVAPALFWGRMAIAASIAGAAFLLLFARVFPDRKIISVREYACILGPALFFGVATFTNLMVRSLTVSQGFITGEFGPIRPFYALYPPVYILGAIAILVSKYRRLSGVKKMQLKYSLLGIVLAFVPGLVANGILPALGVYKFNSIGPLFIIVFVICTAYAILRHAFLDIRIVIQRGLIFAALLTLVIGCYVSIVFILGLLFQRVTHLTVVFGAGVTTLVGIFGTPQLERYFRKLTDNIFFKDRYAYSDVMHRLSEVLNRNFNLEQLGQELVLELKQIFKIDTAYLLLVGRNRLFGRRTEPETVAKTYSDTLVAALAKNPRLIIRSQIPEDIGDTAMSQPYGAALQEVYALGQSADIEAIIPIVLEDVLLGIVGLSTKRSGDAYTKEDLQLLKTFSNQAAVALKKAELFSVVEAYSRKLEERVWERTAELEALQSEQQQMLVDVSHGLQTPLTVLKGELALLHAQVAGADADKFAVLEKSIDEVSRLMYDLLHLAKLETNQSQGAKEFVDMGELVRGVVEYVNVLVQEKHIALQSRIEPGIMLQGDASKLEELLTNLLSNAVKFTSSGRGQHISVTLRRTVRGVELIVADTGIGIRPEDVSKIFQRFYQVKDPRHPVEKGTGLGLAIAKRIAEKHGGRIEVVSAVGKGTTFTVIFPQETVP